MAKIKAKMLNKDQSKHQIQKQNIISHGISTNSIINQKQQLAKF